MGQVSFLTFFLLFPSGRFVPRWTRWGVILIIVLEAHYIFLTNPLLASKSGPFDFLAFAFLAISVVVLQVYRYSRVSTFRERQQTKWVVFGFSLAIVGFVSSAFLLHQFLSTQETLYSSVFQFLVGIALEGILLLLIPFSIAIAVLRSRLYDIDTVINKALVYGLLTALLALVYAGLIFALQYLLRGVINQNNDVAIVISTLAIAALFHPLRRRIQLVIDRRFYRSKYDTARIVENFSATLRDELDLSQLSEQLVAVVQETMQPKHVSLWLRPRTYDGKHPMAWKAADSVPSERVGEEREALHNR